MDGPADALFRGKKMVLQPPPDLGTIEAKGSEVRSWLNGLVTCDLVPVKAGEGAFGLCTGKVGKIIAELYIALDSEERFLIGLRRAALAAVLEHFDRHLVMEDVSVTDVSAEIEWLFLHGAPAKALAAEATSAGGRLFPLDFTGTGACAVIAPPAALPAVKGALVAAGGDALLVASADDWNAFRVERGIPSYGQDFDENSYPQEAALERFGVSFQKGCYLGQEAVFMLQVRGHVKKRLVQLAMDASAPAERGSAIALPDGSSVGAITSVAPPAEGRRLALGHVKYKHAKPGEAFVVGGAPAVSTEVIPAPKE
jgi:tRNA-modifying protein YgfZ